MIDHSLDRRVMLRGAGAAAGAAALAGVALATPAEASGSGVTGAWVVTHQDNPPGDTTKVTAVVTFASGGVFSSLDVSPSGPPGSGAWSADGSHFRATFWIGEPPDKPGAPNAAILVKVRGTVDGDKISGTYTVAVYVSGKKVDSGTGKFWGTRLVA